MEKIPLIGDVAPEFLASTTNGKVHFPDDFAGSWIVFFSHPSDFTPVCTTEFIAFQQNLDFFKKLNTKLIGLSVGTLSSHLAWLDVIQNMPGGIKITFPLIDDLNMKIAKQYGMIQENSSDTHAVRAVFIIDTNAIIRTILFYPATIGRNIDEIKRILVALQTADAFGVATPANWSIGKDVLIPAPNTADKMRKNKSPWFLTYKKLNQREINDKIQNKTGTQNKPRQR